jgi:hypothetical protein
MYEDNQVAGILMPDADADEVAGNPLPNAGDGGEVALGGHDIQPCL